MALQPLQLAKLGATAGLLAMLFGCGANTPTLQTSTAPSTTVSDNAVTTELPPLDPEIEQRFNLGIKAMAAKNYDKAEEVFLKMTQAYPDLSGPYANLGTVLKQKQDFRNAENAFKQALRLNAENAETYNHLALLYRQSGRFNDALQTYKQGLMIAPENTNLLRNIGILLELYLGSPATALEYYQRYLEQQPDDKQVQLWVAVLTQQQAGS